MKRLVIVESPTKAKTLKNFLGPDYTVEASFGHLRDLPKSTLGVDTKDDFKPEYVVVEGKETRATELKKLAKESDSVILATDPDREGEAIAWHAAFLLENGHGKDLDRIVFHEITSEAIQEAIKHPRKLDMKLVNSQQARRVLDRLVGYQLSPLLWKKVRRGLSAGRVQSVAVRLIVEREREILAFKPVEFWVMEAEVSKEGQAFTATLVRKNGEKLEIHTEKEADQVYEDLSSAAYVVNNVERKEVRKNPYPPFTTSTLQQAANSRLGFTSKKTMKIAQDLYENGLITYMRTDSVTLAASALQTARGFIQESFGSDYIPPVPRQYVTKSKMAQEAHEAIRPTSIGPIDKMKATIKADIGRDHANLYELIWQRMIASQMTETVYDQTQVTIDAANYQFVANGSLIKFPGWRAVYGVEEGDEVEENRLPELSIADRLTLEKLGGIQKFTQPPPHYTEASLIKALEERGIGRPSTYAPIISTIMERRYVEKDGKKLIATSVGMAVTDFLVENFKEVTDYDFTAKMEDDLDEIAHGKIEWVPMIKEFYTPFEKLVESVGEKSKRVKIAVEETDEICPEDGGKLVIRTGRFGKFMACANFPKCKFTKTFEMKVEGNCPDSGDPIVVRKTKRGRTFYGCGGYPKCKWMSWTLPENAKQTAPETTPATN
jgi:DNA topoisomerase-1